MEPCAHVEHDRGTDGLTVGRQVFGPWEDCPWQTASDDEPMPADGQDQWTLGDARAAVAQVRVDMRAEVEARAEVAATVLERMRHRGRVRYLADMFSRSREDRAALDYAEMRLSEMRAQLESLAAVWGVRAAIAEREDGPLHPAAILSSLAADQLRDVARG